MWVRERCCYFVLGGQEKLTNKMLWLTDCLTDVILHPSIIPAFYHVTLQYLLLNRKINFPSHWLGGERSIFPVIPTWLTVLWVFLFLDYCCFCHWEIKRWAETWEGPVIHHIPLVLWSQRYTRAYRSFRAISPNYPRHGHRLTKRHMTLGLMSLTIQDKQEEPNWKGDI